MEQIIGKKRGVLRVDPRMNLTHVANKRTQTTT